MQLRSDKTYKITDEVKTLIQSNNGKLISIVELKGVDQRFLYAVGDYTCDLLIKNHIKPQIMVFDLTTERGKKTYPDYEGSIVVENQKGTVSGNLIKIIRDTLEENKKQRIRVIGEEDLAVLPIIFYAPFNSLVVYGIPGSGTGSIKVTAEHKKLVERIFEKMEVI